MGCSLSSLRRWRRDGSVADRRRTSAGGLERIEVRVPDVIARARRARREQGSDSSSPERSRPAEEPPASPSPSVDRDSLLERIAEGERRAVDAERRLHKAEMEARVVLNHLTLLAASIERERQEFNKMLTEERREFSALLKEERRYFEELLEDERQRLVTLLGALERQRPSPPRSRAEAPSTAPRAALPAASDGVAAAGHRSLAPRGRRPLALSQRDPASRNRVPGSPWARHTVPLEPTALPQMIEELRHLYVRLAQYQQEGGPVETDRRIADLARYDALLLATCAALSIPIQTLHADRLDSHDRVWLTRELAAAGVDIATPTVRPGRFR